MRIAICFSGQLRSGVKSSNNLLNFFGELFTDCDFFVHTWDINSYRPPLNLRINPIEPTKVPEEDFKSFYNIYKPKNFFVENQKQYWDYLNMKYGSTGDLVHLWHSFYYSVLFKRAFEDINKFKYDIVIKLRPDCIFPPDRKLKDDIDEFLNKKSRLLSIRKDDIYFISNSEDMDIISNFYIDGGLYGEHMWPMHLLENFLNKNSIEIDSFDDYRFTIFRQEFMYMDPIEQYYHLNAINSFIYEDIRFASSTHHVTYQNLKDPNYIEKMKSNLRELFDYDAANEYFNLKKFK